MQRRNNIYTILFILLATTFVSVQSHANDREHIRAAEEVNDIIEKNKTEHEYQQFFKEAESIVEQKTNDLNNALPFYKEYYEDNDVRIKEAANFKKIHQHLKEFLPNSELEAIHKVSQDTKNQQINQLLVFISSSVPEATLSQYAEQVRVAGGVLVMRGIINNSFKQTASFIYRLSQKGTRAIIDPHAFRNFQIEYVPQIVLIDDHNNCKWGRCDHTPLHDKIAGNISLEYALEEIVRNGEFTKEEAQRFLYNLRNNENG